MIYYNHFCYLMPSITIPNHLPGDNFSKDNCFYFQENFTKGQECHEEYCNHFCYWMPSIPKPNNLSRDDFSTGNCFYFHGNFTKGQKCH